MPKQKYMGRGVTCRLCGREDCKVSPGGFIFRHKNPNTKKWCVPGHESTDRENNGQK